MAAAVPPGGTVLDTFKKSFTDVPVDAENENAISTSEYLDAATSLTGIFDVLGSVKFAASKQDIINNVKKVRKRQLAAPLDSQTLQDLVRNEGKAGSEDATEGLVWLNRGLEFTCTTLQNSLDNPNEELSESFTKSYNATLYKHHMNLGFMMRNVATTGTKLAISACPYRNDFYAKLGDDLNKVVEQLRTYLAALQKIVDILNAFFLQWEDEKKKKGKK